MLGRKGRRTATVVVAALLAACGGGADEGGQAEDAPATAPAADIDYAGIGLWDDGPCDESKPPLVVGQTTTFESPVVSLRAQAVALEAAAEGFNARGGANGSCIEVHLCDDGNNIDQAIRCVDDLAGAGVVVTINDLTTAGAAEVSAAFASAGIPRVASNVSFQDWQDQNAYPLDPSAMGGTFMHPAALLAAGVESIGMIRVDLASASALLGLINGIFEDDGLSVDYETPVPAGTTDYSQFVLGAQDANVGGLSLHIGEQEGVQIVRAAQQLSSELKIAVSLSNFSFESVTELDDFAEQLVFDNPFPPATFDLPVFEALRADLAASGEDDLQPATLRAQAMRSWIGLYALLYVVRDAGLTEFTGQAISQALQSAAAVPMLGMYGDETWTPDFDAQGLFQRTGMSHWGVYAWDPEAAAPDGLEGGNFVEIEQLDFLQTVCGSPVGAPEPC